MTSNIYLSQSQIHDMFQFCETKKTDLKGLDIPSFGDATSSEQSPEFQQEVYYFASGSKRDEHSITNPTNHTNRHPSQDSILECKDDYIKSTISKLVSTVPRLEYENLKKDSEQYHTLMKLNSDLKAQQQMITQINTFKSQIYIYQQCNKKLQINIYQLLQNIKVLENQNQTQSDELLSFKLQIQDQLKTIQQGKIDIEKIKIEMLFKDQELIEIKETYNKLLKESERIKQSKSAQRSTYMTNNTSNPFILSRINNYCQGNTSFILESAKKIQ